MSEILRPIFEWLVGHFQLFESPVYNYIVMAVIGVVSFRVAFDFVGKLYNLDIIDGRIMGAIIHWTVRLIVFTVLFVFGSIAIRLHNLAWSWWIWLLISAAIISIIMVVAIIIKRLQWNFYR